MFYESDTVIREVWKNVVCTETLPYYFVILSVGLVLRRLVVSAVSEHLQISTHTHAFYFCRAT
jgi:hypothetical protein